MKTRTFASLAFFVATLACGAVAPSNPNDAATPADTGIDAPALPDASSSDAAPDASLGPLAQLNVARSLFGAVTGDDGLVRVYAGYTPLALTSLVEAYDEAKNTWTKGAFGKVQRYAHNVAKSATGDVYVIGGTSNGSTAIGSVEVYTPKTDTWTTAPNLPTPRLGLGTATAKDGRIFTIGGGLPGKPTSLVEVYSPDTKTWAAGPNLPTPRLSLQAVTGPDGLIYAIGGRDANTTPLTVVEVLDPVAGTWTTGPSMAVSRYWFAATLAQDGRILALGGISDAGFTDSVEALTIGTGWSSVKSLPETRAWLGAAVAPNGRVLAIGGATDTGQGQPPPLATMFSYDAVANVWSK